MTDRTSDTTDTRTPSPELDGEKPFEKPVDLAQRTLEEWVERTHKLLENKGLVPSAW